MFGLGTFAAGATGSFPGLVLEDRVIDLRPHFGATATTGAMLVNWDDTLRRLHEIAGRPVPADAPTLDRLRPLPPIQPLGQFFCAGANYRKHLTEIVFTMARNDPDELRAEDALREEAQEFVQNRAASGQPFVFAMPSERGVRRPGRDRPLGSGVQHDWELELALVIGRPARNVTP